MVSRTLDAVKDLDYPRNRLQVVVADDSTDETKQVIDRKIEELHHLGVSAAASRRSSRSGSIKSVLRSPRKVVACLLRGQTVPEVMGRSIFSLHYHFKGFSKMCKVSLSSFPAEML